MFHRVKNMISTTAIRGLMKIATKNHISDRAVSRMRILAENFVKATTKAAENLLEEHNKYRECQGLKPRKRLTEEEIEEVIRCTFDN